MLDRHQFMPVLLFISGFNIGLNIVKPTYISDDSLRIKTHLIHVAPKICTGVIHGRMSYQQ